MITKLKSREKKNIVKYFEERYGLGKALFSDFGFYMNTKKLIFMGPKSISRDLDVVTTGMLILRMEGMKPSSNIFQLWGGSVSENFIELTREETLDYLAGKDLEYSTELKGYVCLKYKSKGVGCGLIKEGIIQNMLPKARYTTLEFLEK